MEVSINVMHWFQYMKNKEEGAVVVCWYLKFEYFTRQGRHKIQKVVSYTEMTSSLYWKMQIVKFQKESLKNLNKQLIIPEYNF